MSAEQLINSDVIERVDPNIIHQGPLHIHIDGIGEFDTNFLDPQSLLINIGHTLAVLMTDFEQPSIEMVEGDWVITKYDPKRQILDASYVGKDEEYLLDGADLFDRYDL